LVLLVGRALTQSVLLRVLEYYDGILFLTTNRLRSFDIAVQSRIRRWPSRQPSRTTLTRTDVAIEYGDLTADQREAIFKEFLGQLKQGGLIERWDNVLDWVQEEGKQKTFNGRQIRNIVSTAMALAHAEKRGLLRKDLSEVALNTSVFKAALADQDAIFRNSQFKPRW
jgi:SpoVK/Ycf46/Vps4 family AAA+-type ATPase